MRVYHQPPTPSLARPVNSKAADEPDSGLAGGDWRLRERERAGSADLGGELADHVGDCRGHLGVLARVFAVQ
jgi:hypothetical protein